MDLKKMENIIRIAEEKNITRAADKLYISQPALNLQLLNLEKELGTKLFYRRGNEWAITEAGRIYVDTARKMLLLKRDCYSKISDIAQTHNEEISIAAPGIQGDYMMTYIYKRFHETNPNVKLQLNVVKGIKAQELVRNNTIDLAIVLMGNKQNYRLEYEFLARMEILLAISEKHPMLKELEVDVSGQEVLDLQKFGAVPFILGAKDSTERSVSERVFEEVGIDPVVYMDGEGIHYQMEMVASGACCALTSANNRPDIPESVRLVKLRTHPMMNAFAVRRKDRYLSEPMQDLILLAKDYWMEFSD